MGARVRRDKRILAVDVAGDIDGAALVGRLLNVAVGAEDTRCREHAPRTEVDLRERARVVGAFSAVGGSEFSGVGGG